LAVGVPLGRLHLTVSVKGPIAGLSAASLKNSSVAVQPLVREYQTSHSME
jgi:hypothetical protein